MPLPLNYGFAFKYVKELCARAETSAVLYLTLSFDASFAENSCEYSCK